MEHTPDLEEDPCRQRGGSITSAQSVVSASRLSLLGVNPAFCRQSSILSRERAATQADEPVIEKSKKLINSKTELIVFVCMALLYFVSMCALGMIAPFFSLEAKEKGSSDAVTGLIFAVYPLVMFVFSPIVGKYIPVLGVKFTLIAGSFIEGSTEILFGFVADMPSGNVFIVFCFLIRSVTAIGSAMTMTAALAIVSIVFRQNLATAMGILELFAGIGLMAGPAVGGGLFGLGGFRLPFIAVGGIVLLNLLVIYWLLPGNEAYQGDDPADKEPGSLYRVLSVPGVAAIACVITSGGLLLSFLDPTLSFHLENITNNGLTKAQIGLVFLIAPTLYTLTAPMFGAVADKMVPSRYLILGGHAVVFISYFFIGPSPLVASVVPSRLWVTGVSLAVLGVGIAPFIIPCIIDMQSSCAHAGIPLSLGTNSILSGIFGAAFNVGAVVGPTLGGSLVEHMSFHWAATIFSLVIAFEGFCLLVFTIWERTVYFKKSALLVPESCGIFSERIEPVA